LTDEADLWNRSVFWLAYRMLFVGWTKYISSGQSQCLEHWPV